MCLLIDPLAAHLVASLATMAPPELSAHGQLKTLMELQRITGSKTPSPPLLQGERALLSLAGNSLVEGVFYILPIHLADMLYVR